MEAQAKAAADAAAAAAAAAAQQQADAEAQKQEPVKFQVPANPKAVGDLLSKVVPAHEKTIKAAQGDGPNTVKHRYVLNLENNSLSKAD